MNSKNKRMILSASRVKQFSDCSWLFYQTYFLKVPDITHPKTKLGSLAHAILEALCKEKHHKHYSAVIHHGTIYGDPAIARMVKMFRNVNSDVTDEIACELDNLVFVALNHDFHCKGAKKVLPPEYAFEIDYDDFAIKGFMDRVIIYDDRVTIRDYKTQGKKFTQDQIDWNIQAHFYQTAIKHQFNLPAQVEFLLLRFPANNKDSKRYIQVVPPMTDDQISGFKTLLQEVNSEIERMTPESSKQNLKASRDKGFCLRVCSLREPFDYWVLVDGEKVIRGARDIKLLQPKNNQRIEPRHYSGCPWFYSPTGQKIR